MKTMRCADADDPFELLERDAPSVVRSGDATTPTRCFGLACPKKSDECGAGTCDLAKGSVGDDGSTAFYGALAEINTNRGTFRTNLWWLGKRPVLQTRCEAILELHDAAPMARGARAAADFNASRRMNF